MTRKRFIKKLMAMRIQRNDAIIIAKFFHDEQGYYSSTLVLTTYNRVGGKRVGSIYFKCNGLYYEYRNGHVYADTSVQGTSSLCYPTYNWTITVPMIEGDTV